MLDALDTVGIPWLERLSDPAVAHAESAAQTPWDAAELAWVAGDHERARVLVEEAVEFLGRQATALGADAPGLVRIRPRIEHLERVIGT